MIVDKYSVTLFAILIAGCTFAFIGAIRTEEPLFLIIVVGACLSLLVYILVKGIREEIQHRKENPKRKPIIILESIKKPLKR